MSGISTEFRKIQTPIPHPEDLKLISEISHLESSLFEKEMSIVWDHAEGASVYDRWGNQWIDLSSTIFVTNSGHANPHVKKRILETVNKNLIHAYCYPTVERAAFLKKLIAMTPPYLERASLATTGTEVSERALKLARTYGMRFLPRKKVIIGGVGNFHGKTMGAMMAATTPDARQWIGNQDPDMHQMPFPHPWILEERKITGEALFYEHLEALFNTGVNVDEVAAFIIESYQGWGAIFYPKSYIQAMAHWARERNALLIVDEIQAGFGRTGKLFGYQYYDVEPDLVCCGKGISGGMPLSALLGRSDLIELDNTLTSTHAGHTVACAGALGNLEAFEKDHLVQRAEMLGNKLQGWLDDWAKLFPDRITRILGHGMVWAVFICKPGTTELDVLLVDRLVDRAMKKGVFSIRTGCGTVKLGPPLTIPEAALKEAIDVYVETMNELIQEGG